MRQIFPVLLVIPASPGAASRGDPVSRLPEGAQSQEQLEVALAANPFAGSTPAVRPERCTSDDCHDVDNAVVWIKQQDCLCL